MLYWLILYLLLDLASSFFFIIIKFAFIIFDTTYFKSSRDVTLVFLWSFFGLYIARVDALKYCFIIVTDAFAKNVSPQHDQYSLYYRCDNDSNSGPILCFTYIDPTVVV